MFDNVLAVIPARGGSKGIPGKNIKPLMGKPLIEYTIDAAKQVFRHDRICVSSDDVDIIRAAEKCGLEVPFLRPAHLALDTTANHEVLIHALDFYRERGIDFDTIVMLQPTSPFRTSAHLLDALRLYVKGVEMVVSAAESNANPYYTLFEENANGYLQQSKPSEYVSRQECPRVYKYNGAIYIINVDSLRKAPLRKFERVVMFEMDELYSVDIDTPVDWLWCEFLLAQGLVKI